MDHLKQLFFAFSLVLCMGLVALPSMARADDTTTPVSQSQNEVCTSFADSAKKMDDNSTDPNGGMLTNIYTFIKTTVNDATQKLFSAFTSDSGYQNALAAAITLMVLFYAVGFTIGVVQPSFQQVLIRLAKIGVITGVCSPSGWQFFSDNVVKFFQEGSDQLITGVQAIGMGVAPPPGVDSPFYALDKLAGFLIQPDTLIAILGSVFAGGPFGLTMGALFSIALFGFFNLLFKTLKVYAISFVARAMVLGVAPIFFVFLLFDKTKGLFIAWVNTLVNLSLQPILMFTFLSFFLVMIESASKDMLGAELCWHDFKNMESGVNHLSFWRWVDPKTHASTTGDMTWNGSLECLLPGNQKCPEFPVNIVDVLSFLILVYLAQRFADVVDRISAELSNATVGLDTQGKLDLNALNRKAGNSLSGANLNPKAGGQKDK